jgi:hypothetical protein
VTIAGDALELHVGNDQVLVLHGLSNSSGPRTEGTPDA